MHLLSYRLEQCTTKRKHSKATYMYTDPTIDTNATIHSRY